MMYFESDYGKPCTNKFQCDTCIKKNKDYCIRTKVLYSNEMAELRRCEINNKKRSKNGIEGYKRNTKSGVIYTELVVLINYDKDTETIGKLLEEPNSTKYDYDYDEIVYDKYQVYKYKKRVSKFRSSLTDEEQTDEESIIVKYIPEPYVTSFSKDIIQLYSNAIKFYYTPYRARIYNINDKKWEEIDFDNWDLIYDKIHNSKAYKGSNSTKFIARLESSSTNTFTRNQLTYITTYASEDCFSISDIIAILTSLANNGITITRQQFFDTIKKINTL